MGLTILLCCFLFFFEGRMMDNLLKNNGLEHKRPGALPALICHHLGA